MNDLEWLAVALLALALAFPAGVAFGIRIGQHRERDRQAAAARRSHRNTRHLLDWSNGKGRYDTSIDE